MTATVRLAAAADHAAVTRLFQAVHAHYQGVSPISKEAMARHVVERVLAAPDGCEIALAESGGAAVGLATFAVLHPAAGTSGLLFVKEMFVVEASRGQGVGRAILTFLARLARERGCSRIDWTTETHNPRAIALYERLVARRVSEKVYYRLDGAALGALAGGAS